MAKFYYRGAIASLKNGHYLLLWWTGSDTGSVVLEEVLGAVPHAGGPVGVLPLGVLLPPVLGRVVHLHRGALLLTHTIVVEVLARLQKKIGSFKDEDNILYQIYESKK